jgi:hypothetical protein
MVSFDMRFGCVILPAMTTMLQVKGIPPALRERLEASATRNFRSLNQEALARIQFSFEVEDRNRAAELNKLVGEGLSGEAHAGNPARLREIAAKMRR